MGSFNATCIVSGLPIEAGDKVRFLTLARSAFHRDGNDYAHYVGGRWQLYGVPLKAKYNDYGSVEEIEEGFTNQLFFEALRRGVVEKGVGDNQCHDVEVRDNMTPEKWLEALWEGRVYVLDQRPWTGTWDPAEHQPPVGVPSLLRIENLLKQTGFSIGTDYGAEVYVLDEVSTGFIRVRFGRNLRNSSELERILPILHTAGYAAMITVGTGTSPNYSEVLVAPLPPTDPSVHILTSGLAPSRHMENNQPRPVSQAMVREDVWQILLSTPVEGNDKRYTIETLRASAIEAVEEELAFRAKRESMGPDEILARILRRDMERDKTNSFLYYLGPHEGLSGFTLGAAYRLGVDLVKDPEELKAFVLDLADTVYVQWVYSDLHGQWHPSTNSGQESKWNEHRALLLKLAKIKGRYEDDES